MSKKQYDFPRNYRFITEKNFLVLAFSVVLVVEILFAGMLVRQGQQQEHELMQKRELMEREITSWQEVAKRYPGFADAYLEISVREYELGRRYLAEQYVDKVLELDPINRQATSLKRLLKERNIR